VHPVLILYFLLSLAIALGVCATRYHLVVSLLTPEERRKWQEAHMIERAIVRCILVVIYTGKALFFAIGRPFLLGRKLGERRAEK